MKLRIGGNSLRLRLLRSEVELLRAGQRLEETLRFSADATLTYVLTNLADSKAIRVDFTGREILVAIPEERVQAWATTEEVGIYDRIDAGAGCTLELLVEKDFACLDRSEAETLGTFDHPKAGTAC